MKITLFSTFLAREHLQNIDESAAREYNTGNRDGGVNMKKIIGGGMLCSLFLGIIFAALHERFRFDALFSLSVTFFTSFYHFFMRVTVACTVVTLRKHRFTRDKINCKLSRFEASLYKFLRIRTIKNYVPTYNRALFKVRRGKLDELAHNMIDAEIIHTISAVLSFAPLLMTGAINGFLPFFLTSLFTAAFDMLLVFVQRYNLARAAALAERCKVRDFAAF